MISADNTNSTDSPLFSMTVADVLDGSIEVYKKNFKKLTILALIFFGPVNILLAACEFVMETNIYVFVALLINALYFVSIQQILNAAIIKLIYEDITQGAALQIMHTIRFALSKFWRVLGNSILFYIVFSGIGTILYFVVVMIAFVFLMVAGVGASMNISYNNFQEFGGFFIFLVISALILFVIILVLMISYVYIRFGFGAQSVVAENKSASSAVSRSFEITRKGFWHVFFVLFFGLIIYFLFSNVLGGMTIYIKQIDFYLFFIVNTLVKLFSTVFYPFVITLSTVLFINLKNRNEGFSLELSVDRLLMKQEQRLNKLKEQQDVANLSI